MDFTSHHGDELEEGEIRDGHLDPKYIIISLNQEEEVGP